MRSPAAFIHGHDGAVVIVPARIAAHLASRLRIDALRIEVRGQDPEFDSVLVALATAAAIWRSRASATGNGGDIPAEPAAPSGAMDTQTTADRLGLTSRGVRYAAAHGRLKARKVGGGWLFDPEDVADFAARRQIASTA